MSSRNWKDNLFSYLIISNFIDLLIKIWFGKYFGLFVDLNIQIFFFVIIKLYIDAGYDINLTVNTVKEMNMLLRNAMTVVHVIIV